MFDEKNEIQKIVLHNKILDIAAKYISYANKRNIHFKDADTHLSDMFFKLSGADYQVLSNNYDEEEIRKLLIDAQADLVKEEIL